MKLIYLTVHNTFVLERRTYKKKNEICSIRVSKEEKELIKNYAKANNISISSALKKPFFEMLEDEFDIKICDERYDAYLKSGKSLFLLKR